MEGGRESLFLFSFFLLFFFGLAVPTFAEPACEDGLTWSYTGEEPCYPCQECAEQDFLLLPCTVSRDVVCSPRGIPGCPIEFQQHVDYLPFQEDGLGVHSLSSVAGGSPGDPPETHLYFNRYRDHSFSFWIKPAAPVFGEEGRASVTDYFQELASVDPPETFFQILFYQKSGQVLGILTPVVESQEPPNPSTEPPRLGFLLWGWDSRLLTDARTQSFEDGSLWEELMAAMDPSLYGEHGPMGLAFTPVELGTWSQIAMTTAGDTGTVLPQLHVQGQVVSAFGVDFVPGSADTTTLFETPLHLAALPEDALVEEQGLSPSDVWAPYEGAIQGFAVWREALDSGFITQLFEHDQSSLSDLLDQPTSPQVLAYFSMDSVGGSRFLSHASSLSQDSLEFQDPEILTSCSSCEGVLGDPCQEAAGNECLDESPVYRCVCSAAGFEATPEELECWKLLCPADDGFEETTAGDSSSRPCAEGFVGVCSRQCSGEGAWEVPDCDSCEPACGKETSSPPQDYPLAKPFPFDSVAHRVGLSLVEVAAHLQIPASSVWPDWPATEVSTEATLPCPQGFRGTRKRTCSLGGSGAGEWSPVDDSECVPNSPQVALSLELKTLTPLHTLQQAEADNNLERSKLAPWTAEYLTQNLEYLVVFPECHVDWGSTEVFLQSIPCPQGFRGSVQRLCGPYDNSVYYPGALGESPWFPLDVESATTNPDLVNLWNDLTRLEGHTCETEHVQQVRSPQRNLLEKAFPNPFSADPRPGAPPILLPLPDPGIGAPESIADVLDHLLEHHFEVEAECTLYGVACEFFGTNPGRGIPLRSAYHPSGSETEAGGPEFGEAGAIDLTLEDCLKACVSIGASCQGVRWDGLTAQPWEVEKCFLLRTIMRHSETLNQEYNRVSIRRRLAPVQTLSTALHYEGCRRKFAIYDRAALAGLYGSSFVQSLGSFDSERDDATWLHLPTMTPIAEPLPLTQRSFSGSGQQDAFQDIGISDRSSLNACASLARIHGFPLAGLSPHRDDGGQVSGVDCWVGNHDSEGWSEEDRCDKSWEGDPVGGDDYISVWRVQGQHKDPECYTQSSGMDYAGSRSQSSSSQACTGSTVPEWADRRGRPLRDWSPLELETLRRAFSDDVTSLPPVCRGGHDATTTECRNSDGVWRECSLPPPRATCMDPVESTPSSFLGCYRLLQSDTEWPFSVEISSFFGPEASGAEVDDLVQDSEDLRAVLRRCGLEAARQSYPFFGVGRADPQGSTLQESLEGSPLLCYAGHSFGFRGLFPIHLTATLQHGLGASPELCVSTPLPAWQSLSYPGRVNQELSNPGDFGGDESFDPVLLQQATQNGRIAVFQIPHGAQEWSQRVQNVDFANELLDSVPGAREKDFPGRIWAKGSVSGDQTPESTARMQELCGQTGLAALITSPLAKHVDSEDLDHVLTPDVIPDDLPSLELSCGGGGRVISEIKRAVVAPPQLSSGTPELGCPLPVQLDSPGCTVELDLDWCLQRQSCRISLSDPLIRTTTLDQVTANCLNPSDLPELRLENFLLTVLAECRAPLLQEETFDTVLEYDDFDRAHKYFVLDLEGSQSVEEISFDLSGFIPDAVRVYLVQGELPDEILDGTASETAPNLIRTLLRGSDFFFPSGGSTSDLLTEYRVYLGDGVGAPQDPSVPRTLPMEPLMGGRGGLQPRHAQYIVLYVLEWSVFGASPVFHNLKAYGSRAVPALVDVCGAGSSDLCGLHGTCVSGGPSGFTCVCADGFSGDLCEDSIGCDEQPTEKECFFGGVCSSVPTDFDINGITCVCPSGTYGAQCQLSLHPFPSSMYPRIGVIGKASEIFVNRPNQFVRIEGSREIMKCRSQSSAAETPLVCPAEEVISVEHAELGRKDHNVATPECGPLQDPLVCLRDVTIELSGLCNGLQNCNLPSWSSPLLDPDPCSGALDLNEDSVSRLEVRWTCHHSEVFLVNLPEDLRSLPASQLVLPSFNSSGRYLARIAVTDSRILDFNLGVLGSGVPIRLADGLTSNTGRLEVLHDGVWGTVCSHNVDMPLTGKVVCRQLGFGDSAASQAWSNPNQVSQPGEGPIHVRQPFDCTESDQFLDNCAGWCAGDLCLDSPTCVHDRDIGVTCAAHCTDVRLSDFCEEPGTFIHQAPTDCDEDGLRDLVCLRAVDLEIVSVRYSASDYCRPHSATACAALDTSMYFETLSVTKPFGNLSEMVQFRLSQTPEKRRQFVGGQPRLLAGEEEGVHVVMFLRRGSPPDLSGISNEYTSRPPLIGDYPSVEADWIYSLGGQDEITRVSAAGDAAEGGDWIYLEIVNFGNDPLFLNFTMQISDDSIVSTWWAIFLVIAGCLLASGLFLWVLVWKTREPQVYDCRWFWLDTVCCPCGGRYLTTKYHPLKPLRRGRVDVPEYTPYTSEGQEKEGEGENDDLPDLASFDVDDGFSEPEPDEIEVAKQKRDLGKAPMRQETPDGSESRTRLKYSGWLYAPFPIFGSFLQILFDIAIVHQSFLFLDMVGEGVLDDFGDALVFGPLYTAIYNTVEAIDFLPVRAIVDHFEDNGKGCTSLTSLTLFWLLFVVVFFLHTLHRNNFPLRIARWFRIRRRRDYRTATKVVVRTRFAELWLLGCGHLGFALGQALMQLMALSVSRSLFEVIDWRNEEGKPNCGLDDHTLGHDMGYGLFLALWAVSVYTTMWLWPLWHSSRRNFGSLALRYERNPSFLYNASLMQPWLAVVVVIQLAVLPLLMLAWAITGDPNRGLLSPIQAKVKMLVDHDVELDLLSDPGLANMEARGVSGYLSLWYYMVPGLGFMGKSVEHFPERLPKLFGLATFILILLSLFGGAYFTLVLLALLVFTRELWLIRRYLPDLEGRWHGDVRKAEARKLDILVWEREQGRPNARRNRPDIAPEERPPGYRESQTTSPGGGTDAALPVYTDVFAGSRTETVEMQGFRSGLPADEDPYSKAQAQAEYHPYEGERPPSFRDL